MKENVLFESASPQMGGPIAGTRMTTPYVHELGKLAYLWAWPMVNMHNRGSVLEQVPEPGLSGGVVPQAPLNQLAMLHDYIRPEERAVACPNQDVVYGFSGLSLEREPVVIQVPDFGPRFWVYQLIDQRTDEVGGLGTMYGSKPGFYLVVGPQWQGGAVNGIADVFRLPTNRGALLPRVFMEDTEEDRQAILPLVNQILVYPLSHYTGHLQTKDWTSLPSFPAAQQSGGEITWVVPETFFDALPAVLNEVPPLPGEESLYAWFRSILEAAAQDPALHTTLQQAAQEAEQELVEPLLQFRHVGVPTQNGWTTLLNGAAFGTDYLTRTAVAKSNIFVNKPQETAYFYQEYAADGARLSGQHPYTVTFHKEGLPPARGFWSLTLYDEYHFFVPNELNRYSLGTKNKTLTYNQDGSLTIYVQARPPEADKQTNWLPAPQGAFALYLRIYWPEATVIDGQWAPPPVTAAT